MGDIKIISKRMALEVDKAMCFGLAALGDMDAVLELGHFGNATHREAIERLKKARKDITLGIEKWKTSST